MLRAVNTIGNYTMMGNYDPERSNDKKEIEKRE